MAGTITAATCPRASSTKTRIETCLCFQGRCDYTRVRGQVPQKQGLKPWEEYPHLTEQQVRGQVPQKQGLKLVTGSYSGYSSIGPRASSTKTRIETATTLDAVMPKPIVRGQVPQKQGLKPTVGIRWQPVHGVRGQVPQKQGLKRPSMAFLTCSKESPRASSTKTRIETPYARKIPPPGTVSEGKFHKNKD